MGEYLCEAQLSIGEEYTRKCLHKSYPLDSRKLQSLLLSKPSKLQKSLLSVMEIQGNSMLIAIQYTTYAKHDGLTRLLELL